MLLASVSFAPAAVLAQDARWRVNPTTDVFSDAGNWEQNQVPTGTARFSVLIPSVTPDVRITASAQQIGSFVLLADAPAYTFHLETDSSLVFTGDGVVNNSANEVTFANASGATGSKIVFSNNSSSSAGSSTSVTRFNLTNDTQLVYTGNSTAGTRTVVNLNGANTVLDISGLTNAGLTIGEFADNSSGRVVLGTKNLTVGKDNTVDLTFSGVISGDGSLTKTGSSEWILTGNNTYAGGTRIESSAIILRDGGTLGTGAVTLIGNSHLIFGTYGEQAPHDAIFANHVSGTGSLEKLQAGTLTLTGDINLSGINGYFISAGGGTIQIGAGGTAGSVVAEFIYVDSDSKLAFNKSNDLIVASPVLGGGSIVQRGSGTTFLTNDNSDPFGGPYSGTVMIEAGTLSVGNGGTTGSLGTGNVVNNAALQFYRSNSVAVGNVISGTGRVVQAGTGTTTLAAANTYTGGTVVNAGTLRLGTGGSLASTGALTVNGGTFDLNDHIQTVGTLSGTGGTIALGSGTLTTNSAADSSLAAVITGTGNLVKDGPGTLALAADNTYSGTTTIAAGTLQIGNGGTTGTLGAGAVTNDGTLAFNRSNDVTIANAISGSGRVVQAGTGTTTLTGAKSYTGGTTVNAGTLRLGTGASLASTGALAVNGGTFDLNNNTQTVGTLSGTGGTIALGSATLTTNSSVDSSLASAITGTGGFVKSGSSTLTLSGNSSYSGGTIINAGTLAISADRNLGAASGGITFNGADATLRTTATFATARNMGLNAGGTLDVAANTVFTVSGNVTGASGLAKIGGGTLVLAGTNNYAGPLAISAGTVSVGSNANVGTGTISFDNGATLQATASFSLASGIVLNSGGGTVRVQTNSTLTTGADAISGSGGLTKADGGTLVLSGANTYAGGTTIAGGTLAVSADSNLGIGGTLAFNGGTLRFDAGFDSARTIALVTEGQVNTNGNNAALSGTISGTGGLTKFGAGTLTLSGTNTYLGRTRISSGVLAIDSDANLGAATADLYLGNGGTLRTTGSFSSARSVGLYGNSTFDVGIGTLTLNGGIADEDEELSGRLIKSGAGTLVLAGTNSYSGTTTIAAGVLSVGNGGTTGTLGSGNVVNNATLQFDRFDNVTAANAISGTGALVKLGAGTLTLTGTNTYSGGTTVSAGTLAGTTSSLQGAIVNNAAVRFDQSTNGTYAGTMSGTGSLAKAGNGTVTLTGANTYTGGTTISGGILQLGNGGTTGSITGNVLNNGTLAFNRSDTVTFGGTISGSGALDKLGGGTLILTADNTYSGVTTIAAGTLQLGNGGTTGSIAGNVLNNGILAFNRSDDIVFAGNIDGSGAISYMGPGRVTLTGTIANTGGTVLAGGTVEAGSDAALGAAGATLTFAGGTLQATASFTVGRPVNLITGGGTFNTAGNTLTVSGNVTGAGGLTKTSLGTLILSGISSYTGGTTVSGGILQGTASSLQGDILNNASVVFDQSGNGTYAGAMSGTGGLTIQGGGTITLAGANSYSGGTTVNGGILQGTTTSLQGNILNNAAVTFDQASFGTYAGTMSGTGSLTFAGDGQYTLTGNNSYTGSTTISAGSLFINGDQSAATGLTTVAAGATLGGTGTIGGSVDVAGGGTLTAGTSPGTLTINGNLSLSSGSRLAYEFGQANTPGGPLNDLINVGNNLTLAGTLDIAVSPGGAFDVGIYRLLNYGGTLTDNGLTIGTAPVPTSGLSVQTSQAGQVNLINATGVTLNFWAGGSGVWNAGDGANTNWADQSGVITGRYTNGSFAVFQAPPGMVSVVNNIDQVVSAGMQFAADGYRIIGETVTLAETTAGSGATIMRVGDGTTAGAGFTATIDNVLQGITQLVKTDLGTLVLGGANTYSGGTAINGGTLQVSSDGNLGAASGGLSFGGGTLQTTASFTSGRSVTLNGNGTFATDAATTLTLAGAIAGTGALTKAGTGTLILTGSNSYSGGTTVSGGTLQGTTASLQGNIANNASVVFSQASNGTYAGNMSGTGSLTFSGGGQYTLTGSNSYTGGTSLLAGALIGNSASLQGNILNNGAVTFSQTGSGTYAGNMSGSGSMTLQGGGALTMTGNSTYTGATTVNASTLVVNGSLASSVAVTNGGILSGNGSTGGFVSNGGIIAPGNSIGTLNINGNFTQNGGTYVVEVNAQGQNDRVNVSGTATINGATVQVAAMPGNYATSTTYIILNATGGVSGTYSGVSSNYAFLTPSLTYNTNNVFLTVALQGSTPFSGFGGNTANQRAVGSALDQSYANAAGDFATVIGALANLSTTQASPTLNTISGQPYADFGTFNVANNALFMNALGRQMAMARGGAGSGQRQALAEACDIAACDGASPFSVWGSVLGGLGSVQGDGNSSTFTYNVGGTAAGIDYRVSPSFLVGIGAGFTSGTQWVDSFQGKGWSNSVSVAAYASFTESAFYLDALAGYAYSNNQLQRQISVPGLQPRTANGSTGANQFLGQAEAGYRLGLYAPAMATVTPFARFQTSSINQAAFSEWGANSLSLTVQQQTTTSLRTVLGAGFAGAIGLGNTRTLDLGLQLGWLHEYADTARPMTAAFAGAATASFTVYGATPQRDSAVIGFQAGTDVAAGTQLYLRYDGEVGSGANSHALNVGVRLQW